MDHLIVMNPYARRLRNDKNLSARIRRLFHRETPVIEADSVEELLRSLKDLSHNHRLNEVTVYIVGGDGTFNQILNWVMEQPTENRPHLMPVGGGQFNFMTKLVGLKSTDPSINLAYIFANGHKIHPLSWRPVCVHDSTTDSNVYAAVCANGILCDAVEWYNESGKGGMLDVANLIKSAIADHFLSQLKKTSGRIRPVVGTVKLDRSTVPSAQHAAFMAGTVQEFLPGCTPFRVRSSETKFSVMIYWGSLSRLALSIPSFWHGWKSPLTDAHAWNDACERMEITTTDARILLDGDLVHLPPAAKRTLTVTLGDEIQLLHTT